MLRRCSVCVMVKRCCVQGVKGMESVLGYVRVSWEGRGCSAGGVKGGGGAGDMEEEGVMFRKRRKMVTHTI